MTTITITGKVKRAIWNLPLTSARVSVALKAIYGDGETVFPAETQDPPYKVDTDGTINGSSGFEVQAPTVASGDTAQYGFTVLLLDADGETETQTEQTALLNDADTSLALEDALSGGSAGTGGEITVSGLVYHPFGDGVPYSTGIVTVALVTQFITEDGLFPAISADIPIKDGYFNGDVDLVLYVPNGQSEWLFTFPDGTQKTAMLGTHTSMVEIADIANGDYASEIDPMNVPTSFSATLDGVDVDLTWNDTNSNETGYRIERSDDSGATWDAVTVTSAGATSYTNTSVPADSYIYRIRAEKSGGQSAWVTDTVEVSIDPPDAPSNLVLVTTGTNRANVLLTWDDNSDDETGFIVERSYNNSTWTELTTTAANAETYTDSALDRTQTVIYYRVRAENGNGESGNATAQIQGVLLNLISVWELENTSYTDAVSGYNGTASGTPTIVTGKISNGVEIDSDADKVYVASNSDLQTGDNDWAIAVWFNPSSLTTSVINGKDNLDTGGGREWLLLVDGSNHPWLMVYNGASTQIGTVTDTGTTFSTSTWYHLAGYHSATNNEVGVRVNEGSFVTAATSGAGGTSAADFVIAGRQEPNVVAQGIRDQVLWWKDRIPTAAQLNRVTNGGTGRAYPFNS